MIRISLNDILNATETFKVIMQQSVKGSLAFKIARLARELDKEMTTFNEERQKLFQKYGEKDENGELVIDENNIIKFPPENIDLINEELNSLLSTEVEVNADKLPVNEVDQFELTPQQMMNIEMFFE